jgi:hypothetical protein
MTCILCGLPDTAAGKIYSNDARGAVDTLRELPAWVKDQYPCIADWAADAVTLTDTLPADDVLTATQAAQECYPTDGVFNALAEEIEHQKDATAQDLSARLEQMAETFELLRDELIEAGDKGRGILEALTD